MIWLDLTLHAFGPRYFYLLCFPLQIVPPQCREATPCETAPASSSNFTFPAVAKHAAALLWSRGAAAFAHWKTITNIVHLLLNGQVHSPLTPSSTLLAFTVTLCHPRSLSLNHTLATHTTRSGATFVTGYQRVFLIHLHFINWPQRGFVGLVCPFWSTAETCWCNMVDSGRGPALCVYINSHLLILR